MSVRSDAVTIDISRKACQATALRYRQGDRGALLTVLVVDNGTPVDLTGLTVHMVCSCRSGYVDSAMEVSGSSATYVLGSDMTADAGTVRPYVEVRRGSEVVASSDSLVFVVDPRADLSGQPARYYASVIDGLADQASAAISDAASAKETADSAAATANAAADGASSAAEKATAAASSASSAASSALSASSSALSARDSAAEAATSANSAASSASSSATKADQSAASANSAAASANAAASAAQSAASNANAAAESATSAVSGAITELVPDAVAAEVARYVQVSWTVGEDGGLDATVYDEEER